MDNFSFEEHIRSISCFCGLPDSYELVGVIFTGNLNNTASLKVIANSLLELLESGQSSQWKREDTVHKKP